MRSQKLIQLVSCYTEGEVGNVIAGVVASSSAESLWQPSQRIEKDYPFGWICGTDELMLNAEDSCPGGCRLTDTWREKLH